MNTVYRVVRNTVTGKWIVASELAKGRGKPSSRAIAALFAVTLAVGSTGYAHAATSDDEQVAPSRPTPEQLLAGNTINADDSTRYLKVNGKSDTDDAIATGAGAVAVGSGANAKFADSVAIGTGAQANWSSAIAIGNGSSASQESVAMGHGAHAVNTNAVAIGSNTSAGAHSISIGANAVTGQYATALGEGAVAGAVNSMALGNGAMVMGAGSVALGANSATMRSNVIAVGGAGSERQIVNVAAGTEDTDAVNVSQLKSAGLIGGDGRALDAVVYDVGSSRNAVTFGGIAGTRLANVMAGAVGPLSMDAINGSQLWHVQDQINQLGDRVTTVENGGGGNVGPGVPVVEGSGRDPHFAANGDPTRPAVATGQNSVAVGADSVADRDDSVSVGSTGNERQVTNVAAGTQGTDAANWAQVQDALKTANGYTDDRFNSLDRRIDKVARRANAGTASAMAMASIPQAYAPGQNAMGAGVGTFGGESALAIGASTITESGRWVFKLHGSSNTRGEKGAGAGAAMVW